MLLPSRLEHTTLGDLLGQLYRERLSGSLELVDDRGVVHRVGLRSGEVSCVQSPLGPRLGELLVCKLGSAMDRHVERHLWQASGQRLGEGLVAAGALTQTALDKVLSEQAKLRLDALFRLGSARVVFRPARAERAHPTLSASEYLSGRARTRGQPQAASFVTSHDPDAEALAVLGLTRGASRAEVRSAFRRRALALHPDTNLHRTARDRAETTAQFLRLSAAYRKLVA